MNYNFREKTNKYFAYQFIIYLILFGLALLLVKNQSPIIVFISVFLLGFYVYFIHRLIHNIPKKYNLHVLFHHDSELSIINWLIEVIVNILFFISFYFICLFLKIKFINPIIIFYIGFIYVTTHMVNYSIIHLDKTHRFHHKMNNEDKMYNYGPDFLDHMFNTNYGNYFENNSHILINCIIGFFITTALFKIPIFEK